jgi:hypothetical protein
MTSGVIFQLIVGWRELCRFLPDDLAQTVKMKTL